ncbi:MAG: hypothetical protein LBU34_17640 [Planctomycetaceae bacterium]|nr:hypothetical protein [Planctomycetaceae bacterium]
MMPTPKWKTYKIQLLRKRKDSAGLRAAGIVLGEEVRIFDLGIGLSWIGLTYRA